ncbi:MAG: hypothetical protein KF887_04500 [Paracoccaceae bacterium]|nr:MAG: hypothetical protein KF887_04500 [Paracoccaceae bacterium]
MSKRFENLKKIPPEPAAKLLANANTKLQHKPAVPASAQVTAVLVALETMQARLDMLRLLSVALPPREATWWACLAARDLVGADAKQVPPPLAAAERWVFKPTPEHRAAASHAFHNAEMDDDTVYCAMAALYADGTLGVDGDTANYAAPPNGVSAAVFAMNLIALRAHADKADAFMDMLIDRGVDIARGGNGRVEAAGAAKADAKG